MAKLLIQSILMETTADYWDPLGENIRKDTFNLHSQILIKKAEEYKKHPYRLKRNKYLLLLLAAAIIIGYIVLSKFFYRELITVIIFSLAPLFIYTGIINGFQQNFILFLMCQENYWVYNPQDDSNRFLKLKSAFPDFFDVGHSQRVEDQIWGFIKNGQKNHFWLSTFIYVTGSGKHRTTHKHNIFMLQLHIPLPLNFKLFKKNIFSIFGNDLKTESEEFNKLFRIRIDNNQPEAELILLKILSPSVQVRLIQLANQFPLDKVGFYGDIMVLDFHDEIWKSRYTDFFKEIKVDERDKSYFNKLVQTMISIPMEMLQFID